jgi:hypothetical protein
MGSGKPRCEPNRKRQQGMAREEHHFVRQPEGREGHRGQGDVNMSPKWTIHDQPDQGKKNAETGVAAM